MALSTFTELKTSLGNWLHRTDLTSVIPDFITLCEADYNRRLRVAAMEVRSSATFDEAYEDLPADFLAMREIKVNSDPVISLKYLTPQQMSELYASGSLTTKHYTMIDSKIRLNSVPSGEVEMVYYARTTALSDEEPSNWVLEKHPDVYLYGSLCAAEPYLKNDKRIVVWKSLYEQALDQVESSDKKDRWSGSVLTVRAA